MTGIIRLLLLAVVALVPSMRLSAAAETRPNILVIFTDDQSFRTLGCYRPEGAWPWVETPNIDRLAAEGMRFTSAYGGTWCTPARATFLTGLSPHGIQGLRNVKEPGSFRYDPEVCRFWPAELRKAGYATAMIGKWHLGPDAGHGRDWDHSVVWQMSDAVRTGKKKIAYQDPLMSIDGAPKQVIPGYSTDLFTQYTVDYIGRKHDKPWFVWLNYYAPHWPPEVHPRHQDQYAAAEIPAPANVFGPWPGKPDYLKTPGPYTNAWKLNAKGEPAWNGAPLSELERSYNRLVSPVDEGVGRIVAALTKSGQWENTLIVFTSDQGFTWGDHGMVGKIAPYDANLRSPMIVRWPGVVAPNTVCRHAVGVVDLPPTLLNAAGVKPPWKMHGHDLRPIFEHPKGNWAHPVILQHFGAQFGADTDKPTLQESYVGIPWWISYRQGKHKFIRTLASGINEELYDLEVDPTEENNLAMQPSARPLVDDHRRKLIAELRRTDARLVDDLK